MLVTCSNGPIAALPFARMTSAQAQPFLVEAVLIGILLMLFYRRSAALWPVVLGHYLTDVVDFAL